MSLTTGVIWARRTMKLTRGPETAEGSYHAFITGLDGMGMVDLNWLVDLPQGVILTHAIHINNNGQAMFRELFSNRKLHLDARRLGAARVYSATQEGRKFRSEE